MRLEELQKSIRRFTVNDAEAAAEKIGLNWKREKFGPKELAAGMNVEVEHGNIDSQTDVVPNVDGRDNPVTFAKIALAHLHERPDYYTMLKKVE